MNSEFKKLSSYEKRLFGQMHRLYTRNLQIVQDDIAAIYAKYGENNILEYRVMLDFLTPAERDILYRDWDAFLARYPQYAHLTGVRSEAYKINRLQGLEQQLKLGQLKQGIIEAEEYEKHLEKVVRLGWKSSLKSPMMISDATVKMIANTMYKTDANIAAELLGKKAIQADRIFSYIKDAFIRGDSYSKMAQTIKDRFDVNYRAAKQWVYTEGSRCINEGKAQGFRDAGYTRYIYRTMQDDGVCDLCESMDGEEFSFAEREQGVNFPPMHTNCRCSFEVVIDENTKR